MHSLLDSTHSKCKASAANQRRLTPHHVQHSLYCGPPCCEPYITTQYRLQKISLPYSIVYRRYRYHTVSCTEGIATIQYRAQKISLPYSKCTEGIATIKYRLQKISLPYSKCTGRIAIFTRHRLRHICSWASSGLVAATCSGLPHRTTQQAVRSPDWQLCIRVALVLNDCAKQREVPVAAYTTYTARLSKLRHQAHQNCPWQLFLQH